MESKVQINNSNTLVVILAAGRINHKLNILLSESHCPALLPLNNRPLASYSLEFYNKNGLHPYLIIEEDSLSDVEKELAYLEDKFTVVPISKTKGVVDTLKESLSLLPIRENIIINIVTTVPTQLMPANHVQIDQKQSENINWSCIDFSSDGHVSFYSKNLLVKKRGYAFTGVFHVDYSSFAKILLNERNKVDDLLSVVENISKFSTLEYRKQTWIDCGHRINYLESKPKLISSRSFNAVEVDEIGIIKKSSKNIAKLEDEYLYFSMLPSEISYFFPRVFDFNKRGDIASYRMEYYGYATVAELQLYWSLDKDLWLRFFEKIEIILERFRKNKFSIGKKAFQDFYWSKLLERIEQFEIFLLENHISTDFISEDLIINDEFCLSFKSLKQKVQKRLYGLYDEDDFCIVHGDLCFNNILFDVHSGIVRLIDPRGSFGETAKGIYGDAKYDLAKFMHSSIWNYDYLVNFQFTLGENVGSNNYSLVFNHRKNEEILHGLTKELLERLGYSYSDISFLVSLLFISMTPLHTDSVTKAKAMYLHGIFILNKHIK